LKGRAIHSDLALSYIRQFLLENELNRILDRYNLYLSRLVYRFDNGRQARCLAASGCARNENQSSRRTGNRLDRLLRQADALRAWRVFRQRAQRGRELALRANNIDTETHPEHFRREIQRRHFLFQGRQQVGSACQERSDEQIEFFLPEIIRRTQSNHLPIHPAFDQTAI
jgi:hypothetical protein